MLSRQSWGDTKPPFGTPLDRDNPSTLELRWALPFNIPGGTTLYNPCVHLTQANSNVTLQSGVSLQRGGLLFDNTSNGYIELTGDNTAVSLAANLTIITRVWHDGTAGTLHTILGTNEGAVGYEGGISIYRESGLLSVWQGTGSSAAVQPINGTATFSTGRWWNVAIRRQFDGTNYNYTSFLEGTQDDSGSTTSAPFNQAASSAPRIGRAGAFTTANWPGYIHYFFVWTRALGDDEIKYYSARPFDLYERPRVYTPYVDQSVGGGATSTVGKLLLLGVGG